MNSILYSDAMSLVETAKTGLKHYIKAEVDYRGGTASLGDTYLSTENHEGEAAPIHAEGIFRSNSGYKVGTWWYDEMGDIDKANIDIDNLDVAELIKVAEYLNSNPF